jgi:hypothetical protein
LQCKDTSGNIIKFNITGVYHVPESNVNLISIGQLLQNGASIDIKKDSILLKHGGRSFEALARNNCWFLDVE